MSTPQDYKQSAMEQWITRKFSWVRRASSTSQYPDVPDDRPTTAATDVPSTSVSRPLPVSPVQETSCVDLVQLNDQPGLTGIGCSPRTASHRQTPSELPSRVEETFAVCPRFRIVLVGNAGVGKSTLVSSVFNIIYNVPNSEDGTAIDIAHVRFGKADISHEHFSDENPRFVLHDSMGFETGSTDKSQIVKSFLQIEPSVMQSFRNRLCIETPHSGSRLLQSADEDLLEFANELKIPVIMVFTKYDLLVVKHFRACSHISSLPDRKVEAIKRAKHAFSVVTKELEGLKVKVPFVPVTTRKEEYGGAMLVELTQVTRDNLQDVAGSLWAVWATAQQINARQKVELSISEGFKKYWRDLGESVFFLGHRMIDCIERIHNDVLKIWNFNDLIKVLSGEEFLKGMIRLVEPLSNEVIRNQRVDNIAGLAANVVTVAGAVGSNMALPALGTAMVFQFLNGKYQKGVSTATYLAAYIVDLILVLHEISMVVTVDPPKSLSTVLVMDALATYKPRSSDIHAQVKVESFFKLEEKIATVIRDALRR